MNFELIPAYADEKDNGEQLVHAIIETPRDTRLKYAFEPKLEVFKLKQVLAEGLQWPYDYGFIPQTRAADGDPLDVLVLSEIPTFTGCLIECRVLGLIGLDKNGTRNDRLVAAPRRRDGVAQPSDGYNDISDVPKDTIEGITRFLIEYPEEQGHKISFNGVRSKEQALKAIDSALRLS